MRSDAIFTSPFGGEVGHLWPGEGAFLPHCAPNRPPHPTLRVDLSPQGEVKEVFDAL